VIIDSEKRDFISVKFPVRDSANQLIGVAGMSTDITRIRNIEKALRESEANLKAILDSSSESIWSINTNFEIIYANKVVRRDYLESFGVELHKGINILNALPDLVKKESRYQQVFENKVIQFNDKIPTQ
jgi:PAS domain-containing protein